ncbi:DoxX family protein [Mycolicibacterium sp. GF69]|uniref:DoxX family protein n=1 Tax=Mycolicibacterium sp. GF69 TaxID=2267251 RepID=UPI001F0C146E|nr:DoxX family protein [Mycolicibacterium sp. GF69]
MGQRSWTRPWRLPTRIAFRFSFVYFGLFCLWFAQMTFAFTGFIGQWLPDDAVMWQTIALAPVARWVGQHLFGVDAVLHVDSGSGDQAAIWVLVFCGLVVAVGATALWSVIDRRRSSYPRLAAWFFVFLRLFLGGQMLFYGFAKVIPTQMPAPPLSALLQAYGDLSPASVLWLQVGSSYPYEIFLGTVEVVAGMLLFVPRTATLGAVLSLLGMGQVFVLNMTFDVPVKILSFHLMLMSLVLLAPHSRRLADVFVLHRTPEPVTYPPLFSAPRANRIAAAAQVLLGVWVLVGCAVLNWQGWYEYGGGRAKSVAYGIWSVTEFRVDGAQRPPMTTDPQRWHRVVFDQPNLLTYQRMDGELVPVPAHFDLTAETLELPGTATFTVERPSPDQLRLGGHLDGRPVTMSLQRMELNSFTLRNRGFIWVQDYPYFR